MSEIEIDVKAKVFDDPEYCDRCQEECKEAWKKAREERTPIYCKLCGDEIINKGKYWKHVNTNPRHIAIPQQ